MRFVSSSRVSRLVAGAVVAFWVAGCATEHLDAAAPSGVNLTGDWRLNLNLSDDPDKLGPDPDSTPQKTPGSHHGHGGAGRGGGGGMGGPGGGGMGLPPTGSPDGPGYNEFGPTSLDRGAADGNAGSLIKVGLLPVIEESVPPSTDTTPAKANPKASRGTSINRYLRAPLTMSITQNQGTVTVRANMPDNTQTSDQYTAGTKTEIPYGADQTAERTAGWRGPVFVVTTAAKKAGTREDDFAIDDDGRLIMTTQTKGGKLGKVEIKRVYDRMRGAQS